MNKKHMGLSVLIGLVIGSFIGFFSYSQIFARYDAVVASCVTVNQAVDSKLLTIEQVKQLGVLTGNSLRADHQTVASKFNLSNKQIISASKDSVCSQFLVGVNQAN